MNNIEYTLWNNKYTLFVKFVVGQVINYNHPCCFISPNNIAYFVNPKL